MYNNQTENTVNSDALALILGEPMLKAPDDLYIPKDALQVILDAFSGPLDLLLYLIRKQNIDILDIPIAKITTQYFEYINLKDKFQIELAAEYLVMAATLAEIKSKMLLPKPQLANQEEEDPRAELVRRLQEYERIKWLAECIDAMPRLERDIFNANAEMPELDLKRPQPEIKLDELVAALRDALERAKLFEHHHIKRELLSVRERMSMILSRLTQEKFTSFEQLFKVEEGRIGVVVTFVATLELLKQGAIEIVQNELFGTIHIKSKSHECTDQKID